MIASGAILPDSAIELKPCGFCGRTFRQDTLERHQRICQKTSEKKRKVFDSKKQRTLTEDASAVATDGAKQSSEIISKAKVQKPGQKPKKSNWREKHEDLIQAIRSSREVDKKEDKNKISEPKRRVPSDYVQCPGCKRHFNQRAAERHIPWCQEKQQQTPKSPAAKDAKEKLFARVRYRVPAPGRTKKNVTPQKPKTASPTVPPATQNTKNPDREKAAYSSPPSLMENRRDTSRQNINNNYRRETRSHSRGREILKSTTPTESESLQHIIKFKDKFPNRHGRRGMDFEDSFTTEQLQELLRCSRLNEGKCPKTVPGVRLLGSRNNWNSELNINSIDYSTKLPEVSSSELSDSWMKRLAWHRDFDMSTSSSGSSSSSGSLPPMSRESPSDNQVSFYCHLCHHKFPLVAAKYCCECGARRRGAGSSTQTV